MSSAYHQEGSGNTANEQGPMPDTVSLAGTVCSRLLSLE